MKKAKTVGVIAALKGRKGFGSKKGVSLLSIVQKLSNKRKELGGDTPAHEASESPSKKAAEAKTGEGGPGKC